MGQILSGPFYPVGHKLFCQPFCHYIWVPMNDHPEPTINMGALLESIRQGDARMLARAISLIENESPGYMDLLRSLKDPQGSHIIGITGPPGAGKSTLVDALAGQLVENGSRVAILCVDPSSPFHHGALLGDRIRMNAWYNHPDVFIRSLATRGSLGGLHPKIIEITDLLKDARFDYILVETVGVGQSEVEIAGLADTTVVVLVPEAGDEIQTMKSGLMEVADIFVVNKSDRPEADQLVKNLRFMLTPAFHKKYKDIPVVKTIATQKEGLKELTEKIFRHLETQSQSSRKSLQLTERAYQLILHKRMRDIKKIELEKIIKEKLNQPDFNIYEFVMHF
jgi:LAO/AO transport system kinase